MLGLCKKQMQVSTINHTSDALNNPAKNIGLEDSFLLNKGDCQGEKNGSLGDCKMTSWNRLEVSGYQGVTTA